MDKVLKAVRRGEAADGRDDRAQCEERVRYVKIPVFKPESAFYVFCILLFTYMNEGINVCATYIPQQSSAVFQAEFTGGYRRW